MKIALLGYGKMGKAIEALALDQSHEIVLKIDEGNRPDLRKEDLEQADVAIEFSRPESALENIIFSLEAGVPVVSGTTGWLAHMEQVEALVEKKQGAFFYASNFSLGVNLFFALNTHLARLMNAYPQYATAMEEIHHTQKLDAPSGTAITLAEGLIRELDGKSSWINEATAAPEQLPITSKRIDQVPGTHTITYTSKIDQISITHEAFSRQGFAQGALLAAEWMQGKQGCFNMQDLLGIKF